MADYNSTFTGPQIDAALGEAQTATQPGDLSTVATSGDYSDLANQPTLGTAAATDATDYATAAQGVKADSAVQPGNLATVATSGQYGDLTGSPTLGSAAAQDFTNNDDLSVDPGNVPTRGNVAAAIAAGGGGGSRGVLHVRDEKPSGTQGGTTTADTTIVRDLNTVVVNTIIGASLVSNTITLPEGTYMVSASCPAVRTDGHKAHLYNETDASIEVQGQNNFAGASIVTQSGIARVEGLIVVPAGGKDYTLRHYFRGTRAITGLGQGVPNTGVEIYSNIIIYGV